MLFVRRHISNRPRTDARDVPFDEYFQCSGLHENHFFPFMMVRRMRHLARRKRGYVQVNGNAFVRSSIEHLARFVVSGRIAFHW